MSEAAVKTLLEILDLEQIEVNMFRGVSPADSFPRIFGGQVVAQALVAASRTVEAGRKPHSLHAYFILGGDPKIPILFQVERIRDGKSFSTRRVLAIQHGAAIFSLMASYHIDEEGVYDHQIPMPKVRMPEHLPSEADIRQLLGDKIPESVRLYFERDRPIEMRAVEYGHFLGVPQVEGKNHIWMKASAQLPDDPAVHEAVLAYASDYSLLDAALVTHGKTVFSPDISPASLDHALWLHRPFRADEWFLYAQDSPSMTHARGFSRGSFYAQDGTLFASVAQEGILRVKKKKD